MTDQRDDEGHDVDGEKAKSEVRSTPETSRRSFMVGAATALSGAMVTGAAGPEAPQQSVSNAASPATFFPPPAPRPQTLARINLAPDGRHPGPLTLTPNAQLVLIPNQQSDNLQIMDAETMEVVSTLNFPAGSVPWKAAVTPDSCRALVALSRFGDTSGAASQLALVELVGTPWISRYIPVGVGANDVVINSQGTRAYVANQRSNTVSVVDISSWLTPLWCVVATIPVGRAPHGLRFYGDRLFVANFADASVSEIDVVRREVKRTVVVGNPTLVQPFPQFGAGDTTQFEVGADNLGYAVNYRSNELVAVDLSTFAIVRRNASPVINPYSLRRAGDFLFVSSEMAGSTVLLDTPGNGLINVRDQLRADCGGFPQTTVIDNFVVWSNLPSTDSILRFGGRIGANPLVAEAL